MDWNQAAAREAEHATDELFQAHRGAYPWNVLGHTVVFGNDGYESDDQTKAEVAKLREYLASIGVKELGFGVDAEEGYTWAMIVGSGDTDLLHRAVWWAWGKVRDIPNVPDDPADTLLTGCQPSIATGAVMDEPAPNISAN